jgi:regulator of G-protein signaling
MKFDSFSRFLKSDLYKDSLLADMAGSALPHDGSDLEPELLTTVVTDLNQSGDSVKNKSAETRRKSILPWNIRNRSKSKDRADGVVAGSGRESGGGVGLLKKLTGQGGSGREERARSSLNLAEVRERTGLAAAGREEQANHSTESCDKEACSLTRFILPDRATTVVSISSSLPNGNENGNGNGHRPSPLTIPIDHPISHCIPSLIAPLPQVSTPRGETIRSLVSRLLEKRGLKFTSFDAFLTGQDRPLD